MADEQELIRLSAKRWINVNKRQDELQSQRLQNINLADAISAFDGLFEITLKNNPPKSTSGLLEMRKALHKVFKK